jgi:hypothetical protein
MVRVRATMVSVRADRVDGVLVRIGLLLEVFGLD